MSADLSAIPACPLCGGRPQSALEFDNEPVLSNRLWPDRATARSAPRGPIRLAFCQGCGAGHNHAFDPSLVGYDGDYENALHHSPTFSRYAEELAADLVARHDLAGRRLLEFGSGSGEFLRRLRAVAGPGTTATGFDPGADTNCAVEGLHFVNRLDPGRIEADFVCARHVLEHLSDPVSTLTEIRKATPVDRPPVTIGSADDGRSADHFADHFADRSRKLLRAWRNEVRSRGDGGVAVWGIGSKGVTFLNRMPDADELITHAVDLNPRKHGRHVPGTGHRVTPPEALTERPPSTVLLMNGIYEHEVASRLSSLDSEAELVVVDDSVRSSLA